MDSNTKQVIGGAIWIDLPEVDLTHIPARVDTGARTSAIWATDIVLEGGKMSCIFFGPSSTSYTGARVQFDNFEQRVVASSNGISEKRFKVKLLVNLCGKRVRAAFTLANRETQVYPVLIGRNVLRGKFIVDVKQGHVLRIEDGRRRQELQSKVDEKENP